LQLTSLPQLSVPLPHCQPSCAHVFEVQPHVFATPAPPQTDGAVHPPQSMTPPQPSLIVPQSTPAVQIFGVHTAVPHLFGPAPPQTGADAEHALHANACPHPDGTCPQSAPCAVQS
jgi:hypothetical protein